MGTPADRLVSLRSNVTDLLRLRTEAESSVKFATQQLERVDQEIRDMGIEPDQAEAQLALLEAQLTTVEDQLETSIAAEKLEYQKILETTKALFAAAGATK